MTEELKPRPAAYGLQNTAITGSNRWMLLREHIPANDQYNGALWTPLYTAQPEAEIIATGYIFREDGKFPDVFFARGKRDRRDMDANPSLMRVRIVVDK